MHDASSAANDKTAPHPCVLVIDDERAVREAVSDILGLENINTITAENGMAGIAHFKANRDIVKLILLDLSMPGMGGAEALRQLREIDSTVPIILTSGFGKSALSKNINTQSVNGFVQKPFTFDKLIREIRQHI